jgi:hypothetical protein
VDWQVKVARVVNQTNHTPESTKDPHIVAYEKVLPPGTHEGWVTIRFDYGTFRIDPRQRFPRICCQCLSATDELWNTDSPVPLPFCSGCSAFWKYYRRRRLWVASAIILLILSSFAVAFGMALRLPVGAYAGLFLSVWIGTLGLTLIAGALVASPADVRVDKSPTLFLPRHSKYVPTERARIRFRNQNYARLVVEWNTVHTVPGKPIVVPRQRRPRTRKRGNG